MRKIISQTVVSAGEYLGAFGFDEDQVGLLIETGKRDLEKIVMRLDELLRDDVRSPEEIDGALHALKGLLFHLGNHELAEKIEQMRSTSDDAGYLPEITALLS